MLGCLDVDGKERISMSSVTTYDGKEHISDRLSGYATSFVDVAKDPYILKLIQSDLVVGTAMLMERIGAGEPYCNCFSTYSGASEKEPTRIK